MVDTIEELAGLSECEMTFRGCRVFVKGEQRQADYLQEYIQGHQRDLRAANEVVSYLNAGFLDEAIGRSKAIRGSDAGITPEWLKINGAYRVEATREWGIGRGRLMLRYQADRSQVVLLSHGRGTGISIPVENQGELVRLCQALRVPFSPIGE